MDKNYKDIVSFVELANCTDSRKLRACLEHLPKEKVTSWKDEHGLDVMHHFILANNSEMVEYLLKSGFFVRPWLPELNPYSHLAALLGERTLLQVLLQYRPDDCRDLEVPIRLPDTVVEKLSRGEQQPGTTHLQLYRPETAKLPLSASPSNASFSSSRTYNYTIESLSAMLNNLKINPKAVSSPLELSAKAGHVECVRVIINHCVLKNVPKDALGDTSDFTLASLTNSPQSLALLLHHKCPSTKEWEAAVATCLQHAHIACLDILLQMCRETKHMFKGVNFFHILYTSAKKYLSYPRLMQTTEVLIKHGHQIMARLPYCTYPMYSLLANAFCYHDYGNTQYYIKALRVLLSHGANPSFDETKIANSHGKQMASFKTAGRHAFSSALHCLLQTVESSAEFLDSPAMASKFVDDCVRVLMGSGKASMNHVGYLGDPVKTKTRGTILHQFAHSTLKLGASPAMIKCILRHGADPNLKVDEKYAINIYFDRQIQEMLSLDIKEFLEERIQDAMLMCQLCVFMTQFATRDCSAIFAEGHGQERSQKLLPYVKVVKEELSKRSRQVHRLQDISSWAVWIACGCHSDRVNKLDISSEIKMCIFPLTF